MRLFFAVDTGEAIKDRVTRIIEESSIRLAPWRWIRPENYHFTLKFLGEVDPGRLASLQEAAGRAAARARPFQITMGNIGGFPDLDRPRVVFYGIEGGFGALRDLAGLLEDECGKNGFERERRRFRAHLTLARLSRPAPEDALAALRSFPPLGGSAILDIDHFVLISSRLTRSGAVYEEVSRFALGP
jgi:2'-5' RNA ligase